MNPIRPEIEALERSGIAKVAAGALDDPEVIPLWFGESDIVTPEFIRAAATRALEGGKTFYSHARGQTALRSALKRYNDRIYKIDLDPDRITVPGSTMLAVMVAAQCLLGRDDEAILIAPYWPNIRIVTQILGGRHVDVRLEEGPGRWWLDLDKVAAAITPRTKAVYVNSPANPTGWIMTEDEQRALLDLCRKHGLGIIADEVYHRNVFDGPDPAPSFLTIAGDDEPVFVLNGFSKGWAMTGWRLGWMVAPRHLEEPMAVLAECSNTSATAFVQFGGVAALEEGEPFIEGFVARTRRNRDLVMEILGAGLAPQARRCLLRLPEDRRGDRQPRSGPPHPGRDQGRHGRRLHLRAGQRGPSAALLRDRHAAPADRARAHRWRARPARLTAGGPPVDQRSG